MKIAKLWAEVFFFLVKFLLMPKFWLLLTQDYLAPEIISHFVMHGARVTEIVKYLISFFKTSEDDLGAIFLEALKKVIAVLQLIYSHMSNYYFLNTNLFFCILYSNGDT